MIQLAHSLFWDGGTAGRRHGGTERKAYIIPSPSNQCCARQPLVSKTAGHVRTTAPRSQSGIVPRIVAGIPAWISGERRKGERDSIDGAGTPAALMVAMLTVAAGRENLYQRLIAAEHHRVPCGRLANT